MNSNYQSCEYSDEAKDVLLAQGFNELKPTGDSFLFINSKDKTFWICGRSHVKNTQLFNLK
jgi:hypothetical protein